ncbi:MAG: hypothetical protein K6E59_05670 [Bacilli bacterium]|nr:hypothetical protein [Bacilli bacterium]
MGEDFTAKPVKEVTGFRMLLGHLGMFLILIGLISALPMLVVPFFPDEVEALPVFGGVAGWNIIVGATLFFVFSFKKKKTRFFRRQESVLLMLIWLCAIFSGAAPFFIFGLMGKIDYTFTGAVFESTSGYTTTGLTVFRDFIDVPGAFCSHVLTFHRALTNFIGGVGLVLLVASVLGASGGGVSLYVSEGHADRLLPNITKSAKLIFGIYFFYTALGFVALMLAGMPVFDALTHSMSALSGGGFSCRANNIASYRYLEGQVLPYGFMPVNSLMIEIIIMVLVIFSAISFMLHTYLLRFRFKTFFGDDEIRYAIIANALCILICFFGALGAISASTGSAFFEPSGEVLRASFFYIIGATTNSGFSSTTTDSSHFVVHFFDGGAGNAAFMGHTFVILMILVMLVGGGAGSSAGGIKQYRIVVSIRSIYYSLRYRFASAHHLYPKLTNRYGETKELDDDTVAEAHHYIFLFVGMFLLLTTVIIIADPTNYNVEGAMFDMASAVSNTGLSFVVGPDYATTRTVASFVTLWAMSVGMLLGRLEILPAAYAVSNIPLEIRHRRQQKEIRLREKEKEAVYGLEEGD